jgi:phage terminase small subunit
MMPATLDADPEARPLNPRHAEFAEHVAAGESQLAAYCAVYGVEPSPSAVVCACKLARRPDVIRHIRTLRDAAAERSTISIAERMHWLDSLVHAEPPVRLVSMACRRCHGHEHRQQWIDERELEAAVTKAAKLGQPAPDCLGGMGYSVTLAGNPHCPHCGGRNTRSELLSTEEMTPAQRALFKGVELHADGSVKRVLMHDPLAASDQLNRMQAAYLDRKETRNVSVSMTAAEAAAIAKRSPAEIAALLWSGNK